MAEAHPPETQAGQADDQAADQRRSEVLVVDASATLAWVFDDERDEFAEAVLSRVAEAGAIVPAHWILEVTNGLLLAHRRRRLRPREHPVDILDRLGRLPIRIDEETAVRAWRETTALAESFRLTTYDAAYLELALRLGAVLVTLDSGLSHAATSADVRILAPDGP